MLHAQAPNSTADFMALLSFATGVEDASTSRRYDYCGPKARAVKTPSLLCWLYQSRALSAHVKQ